MHGQVKVKTTEEQNEAKNKEREKKLQLYKAATAKIFEKRKNKEYDDEGLKLTGEVLAVSSDFNTFWNYRKEIFLHLKENRTADEMQDMFTQELQFLQRCLQKNPKSYGVWHHRCFTMDTMSKPDWKHEIKLCNLLLEKDERNFHCWDYRRFVVAKAGLLPEQELEFTTSKICNNFSNFSSWHYRSKLLPLIYPDDSTSVGVEEKILLKELETVQNAFFTDPDDQSAWFYHRWLLSRGKRKTGVCCIYVSRDRQTLMITTTQPVMISPSACDTEVIVNGEGQTGVWHNHKMQKDHFSHTWIFTVDGSNPWLLTGDLHISIAIDAADWGSSDTIHLPANQMESWCFSQDDQGTIFSQELSATTSDTLQKELESVQELFHLEPENKWVLLTIVSLMKALNPLTYAQNIEEFLSKLKLIDPYRQNYYEDLRCRFLLENYLENFDFNTRAASLCNLNLTCMYHLELLSLVVKLDLSKNKLHTLKGFSSLQCLREINLDENQIQEVEELSYLKDLTQLSVKYNSISTTKALKPLSCCHRLIKLHLLGNPVYEMTDPSEIKSQVPSLHNVDGHIFG